MHPAKESNPSPPSGGPNWPWRAWLAGAVLVVLVTIIYWPTLANGFLFDDEYYVENNVALRSTEGLSNIWFKLDTFEQYYPLVLTTLWAEYQLWELDPRGYHVVNFLLHGAAAVLVWRLLKRLAVPGAWLAAAIFAVHPVEVESVAMTHELKNVLSCVLALGSLLAYLRFSPPEDPDATGAESSTARGHWVYYALAFVLYVTALLAKTVTASVPAVLLVIYWWKRSRLTWRDVARTVPFFAVGLALAGLTVWMEKTYVGASGKEWGFSPVERVLIAGRAVWFYAEKLFWPHPLMWIYPRWVIDSHAWRQYLFPAAALAVIALLWLARKRIGRGPLAAVLIFGGVLVPALGFFDLVVFPFTFVADHFQYHASIALFALAAAAAVALAANILPTQARWLAPLAGAALLVPLAAIAHRQAHVWKDNITVWEDAAAMDPQHWLAHYNLGFLFQHRGKYDPSLAHFRKAIEIREQQARDNPDVSKFWNDVGGCYVDLGSMQRGMGKPAEAVGSFQKAVEIREQLVRDHPAVADYQDGLAWAYVNLALAQHAAGRPANAEASHRRAIEARQKLVQDNPTVSKYQDELAASYADVGLLERDLGRPIEAASAFRNATDVREQLVREQPTVAEYLANLANNYEDLALSQEIAGRPVDAESAHRRTIEIREKLAQGNGLLTVAKRLGAGEIRQKLAQNILAVRKYQNDLAASYVRFGILQRDLGRPAEAEDLLRKAIQIRDELVRNDPCVNDYQDSLAWSCVALAFAQQKVGRPADAEASHRKAIEIREKLARDHPAIDRYQNQAAASYMDLGVLQYDTGQPAEAVSSFLRAIEIREKLVREHPAASGYQDGLAWCYVDLGVAQQKTGRPSEAEHSFRQAIELREQLAQDDPTSAVYRSNLAASLELCAGALALSGKWSASADRYAQAVAAGDAAWQSLGRLALVQLAAGNESGYRATCAELVRRHGENAAPDAAFSIALTLVVGDQALDDMSPALVLATRAADADRSNPMAAILVGAAQYRAGSSPEAIATLTKALSQLDLAAPVATASPNQILVGRLVGEMILALAYREHSDDEALQKQLATLRKSIDQAETLGPQSSCSLPPWAVRFAVEIAKRELAKLSATANGSPLDPAPSL